MKHFLQILLFSFTLGSVLAQENSIHFDGSNDYVDCGNHSSLDITGNTLTIEAWIYPTSFKTNVWEGVVLSKTGGGDNGYMLRVGNGGEVNFNIGTGFWNELYSGTGALTLNNWHHIAGTYDGTTMRLYVDGVEMSTRSLSNNVGSASNNLLIGEDPKDNGRHFPGAIEEVKIWNTYRSANDVQLDMDYSTCTPLPAGLVAYYKFNQGNAGGNNNGLTNVIDEVGNNDGTLTNSSLRNATSNWVTGLTRICPPVMTYTSSTVTQTETSDICPGITDQLIIGIEIVTSGATSPLDLTQIQLNMTGTTSLSDVTNIDIFSTGTSATFATTTSFGSATPAAGTISVNGTQTLSTGTNYFWIVYDIAGGATSANLVDAQASQITIGGVNYTPTITNPAGSRPIIARGVDCPGFGGLDIGTVSCGGSPYVYNDNTTGANSDCSQRGSPDHMYTFTLNVESDVTITNCNNVSTYWDGYLYLYNVANGNCSSGSIISNDDNGCGSIITSNALAPGTYVILIEGYSSSDQGEYELTLAVSNCNENGDTPCEAIGVTVNCGSKTVGSNTALTNSGITSPSCGNYVSSDVWFWVEIPASGEIEGEIVSVLSGITDWGIAAYTGSCAGSLTLLDCNTSTNSVSLSGLTPTDTLFFRIWENGNNQSGLFELEVTDPTNLYCLNGDASMFNFPADTCMEVTPNAGSQRGCAWYQNTIDFSLSFDHTLDVYLGDHDGGDGMTFTFHSDPGGTSICGANGQGLGADGIQNALVIEVDTYDNDNPDHNWDLLEDHVAVWTTASGHTNPIAGPISATAPATSVEDGNVHQLRLVWNAGTTTLDIYFDGQFRLSVTDDFVANVFGSKNVFWGSTGSTGLFTNQMYVCPPTSLIQIPLPFSTTDFTSSCKGENVNLQWTNETPDNISHFVIQESKDAIHFSTVKTVQKNFTGSYSEIIHQDLKNSYYRVLQVEKDGNVFTTNTTTIDCNEGQRAVSIVSDVENSTVFFNLENLASSAEVNLYSIDGKFISSFTLTSDERNFKFTTHAYSKGIYVAKINVDHRVAIAKKVLFQ